MPENTLYDESTLDILGKTPAYLIRWGSTISLGVVLLLISLASWIHYPEILPAPIVITPAHPPIKLYSKSAGKLHFLLPNGTEVQPHQAIAYIENTTDWQDVEILTKQLKNLQNINTIDWYALHLPMSLRLGELQNIYQNLQESLQNYQIYIDLDSEAKKLYQIRKQIASYQRLQYNLQTQQQLQEKELQTHKRKFLRDSVLYHQKVLSSLEYDKSLTEFAQQQRQAKNIEVTQMDNNLQITQLETRSQDIDIEKREREFKLIQNIQNTFSSLQTALAQWKDKYVIEARIAGKVNYLKYWENEQYIRAEEAILTIIPAQNMQRIGKIELSAHRSGKVQIGQQVKIRLADFPPEEYGMLMGKISSIASLPALEGSVQQQTLYMVLVEIPSLRTSYKKDIPAAKIQLQGTAHIITEDMTLLYRIFYQLAKIWNQ